MIQFTRELSTPTTSSMVSCKEHTYKTLIRSDSLENKATFLLVLRDQIAVVLYCYQHMCVALGV